MNTLRSIDYDIFFENSLDELVNFIRQGNYTRFFILTDENSTQHCLPILTEKLKGFDNYDLIEISAGEESKTIEFCEGVWRMLIDFSADRQSLMINLGGGVVTDLGGFCASTFKRGIDFVQVPTTLLSQVDASVGGKTGVDLNGIKNIIGTFTQPKAVFIDQVFTKTLPARQVLSGMAEMLKHGLIVDAGFWNTLKSSDMAHPSAEAIYRSIEIKNEVVIEDPHEKGRRKALNFGHTIGHAVETWSLNNDEDPLTHGEAIAIGMICESWLSHKKSGLSLAELEEITDTLNTHYPRYTIEASCHGTLYSLMQKDKKNKGGLINCTLLSRIGECTLDNICTEDELCESLNYYANLQYV